MPFVIVGAQYLIRLRESFRRYFSALLRTTYRAVLYLTGDDPSLGRMVQ
jgi:hypothetical protein